MSLSTPKFSIILDQPIPKNTMKLDFESNTFTFTPIESNFPVRTESDDNSAEVLKMLREGIEAAQAGKSAEARSLLLRVTEADPNSEKGWLWLASISEYPEELLVFLNSVLRINPDNQRAVEWAKATKSLLSKTFVQRGIDASGEQNDFAKQCFLQAIIHDNENELAWLWLASLSSSDEEKSSHLQKVLSINPDHATAKSQLESIRRQKNESLFQKAVEFAANDENHLALDALQEYFHQSPEEENAWLLKSFLVQSFDEKLVCFDKVSEANPKNDLARMNAAFLRLMLEKVGVEEARSQMQMLPTEELSMSVVNYDAAETEAEVELEVEEVFAAQGNQFTEETETENSQAQELEIPHYSMPEEEFSVTDEVDLEVEEFAPQTQFQASQAEEMQVAESFEAVNESSQMLTKLPEDSEFDSKETGYDFYEQKETGDNFAHTQISDSRESEAEDCFYSDYENKPDDYENVEELPQTYAFQDELPVFAQSQLTGADESKKAEVLMRNHSENESAENDSPDVYEIEASEMAAESNYSDLFGETENPVEELPASFEENATNLEENASQPQAEVAYSKTASPDYFDEKVAFQSQAVMVDCSFCKSENEQQSVVCRSCRAVLTLSDLEMVLGNHESDKEMIGNAVCQLEAEKEWRELNADELKNLALGYLNIGNLSKGLSYLNETAKLNPNDIVLSSQVNALKIRLAEIEKQKDLHDSMPKNLTILVVDDSATVRKLISSKLEKSGHAVICAMDGVDALEKIKEIVPDLVLLDINMPRMDGYQVCKMIRSNDTTKDVPVVMISGKDGFFDKVRGRMAGTTGYITKPFGPETLMKTVEAYIV